MSPNDRVDPLALSSPLFFASGILG